jgi:hypothetical protein
MSSASDPGQPARSTEERAEEMVERITSNASRWLGHAFGRAREELEDLLAEARSLNVAGDAPGPEDTSAPTIGEPASPSGASQPRSSRS